MSTIKGEWKSASAQAAVIVLLTVVAYFPTLRHGFVFDDFGLITNNPMIKASDGLRRFWGTTEAADYYPLTWSFWWLEWRIWGNDATGYHAVNVFLHAVNAVLVWMILRRLNVCGAWLAGLVFALHPVNVATVAWVSEQKNTLSMFFAALAVLFYLRFDEENRKRWYGLSLVAFLLAVLSKSAVVMLPVVLLGCVWWTRGRLRRNDCWRTIPFFVLSLVSALVTIWFQHYRALQGEAVRTEGFAARLATAGWVPWFYLAKALLPFNLTMVYPKWNVDPSLWTSYLPGMILLGCLMFFWRTRRPWGRAAFFGLGYFVVTLFPVLGFFDQGFYSYSLVADHWQYYSIVGIIALVVAAGVTACRRAGKPVERWGVVASLAALLALGVATWSRASVYANNETLWRDAATKNPGAAVAHFNLGAALEQDGRTQEAIQQFEQTLDLKPDYAGAHYDLGNILVGLGELPEGITHYEKALLINPDFAEAHGNLGNALMRLGRFEEAIQHWERALQIKPDYAEAYNSLGAALAQLGRLDEAMENYKRALRIRPDFADAYFNLGSALVRAGRLPEGMAQYKEALRIKPDSAEVHNALGNALVRAGRVAEAIQQYEQAVQINPKYADAQNNWGAALIQSGKIQEAVDHWEQALRINPDQVDAHRNLGNAYLRLNRVTEAIGHYEQALRVDPDDATLHSSLAVALWKSDRVPEAIDHWERALRIHPDSAEVHNNLGAALMRQGRLPDAIGHFEQALQIKPDHAKAHYNLGSALEQTGRLQEAIKQFEQALQYDPNLVEARADLSRLKAAQ